MHEYASRFADLLEDVAARIRAMTVDRIANVIRMAGMGIVVAALALSTVAFLVWAIFGALEIPLTTAGAYGVFAVLFLVTGGILWFKRSR